MLKKIKLKEGDVFAVPLLSGGYCIGLVAREYKSIKLGYFFNRVYSTLPKQVITKEIEKNGIILIRKFSINGIEKAGWVPLKRDFIFEKEEWPIPIFKMQEPLSEKYYAVIYDDTLINENRYLICKEQACKLYNYGLSGYISLERELTKLLFK